MRVAYLIPPQLIKVSIGSSARDEQQCGWGLAFDADNMAILPMSAIYPMMFGNMGRVLAIPDP